jgi:hypothetical protein
MEIVLKLVPKNWLVFQHYKDRSPPWIKLHRDLLNNRDFITLPLASKALAPLLWLLASEHKDGVFDATTEELAFRLRMSEKEVEAGIKPLIQKGFFLDASTMLAPRLQDAIPERETEAETERKGRFAPPSISEVSEYVKEKGYSIDPQQFVDFYAAKGWMVGSNKMKDWKASVRTWVNRDRTTQKQNTTTEVWKNAI